MANIHKLNRRELINSILKDLHEFRNGCDNELKYAVDENIKFFEAAKHLWKYVPWLIKRYPKIDGKRIRELADFELSNGLWEEILLEQLLGLEKKKFPDVTSPLIKQLHTDISKISQYKKGPIIVINVGCGGMEIERKLAQVFAHKPIPQPLVFIGVDLSPAALNVARHNLEDQNVSFTHLQSLTPEIISRIKNNKPGTPLQFNFLVGDALKLSDYVLPENVDIVFHSKFHHHLSDQNKKSFDDMIRKVASLTIEFDDYKGIYLPILSIFTGWDKPVLLNGAVLSSLRDPARDDIRQYTEEGWETKIYPLKGFLKIHHSR
ncbi:MAG: class I SAM-dependent methyltransferase [bacterium]